MSMSDGFSNYQFFIGTHSAQLQSSGVPQHLWTTLFQKLKNLVFDSGDSFALIPLEDEDNETQAVYKVIVTKVDGISSRDPQEIYLVDHAWTFEANQAVAHLNHLPSLLKRMCHLMNVDGDLPETEKISQVSAKMWKYSMTYSVAAGSVEDRMPVWYIMDEFGSAIQHADDPNFRIVPFFFLYDRSMYSLLFPIKDLKLHEEVTRDYIEGPLAQNEDMRKAFLIPWKPTIMTNMPASQVEPPENYFLHGHAPETLPVIEVALSPLNNILTVYSEYSIIKNNLTHESFKITDNKEEADVLWVTEHFKDFQGFSETSPNKFINQFPYENVITIKDLLSIICRRSDKKSGQSLDDSPSWFPITFNLQTEVCQFVSFFQNRAKEGFDNHWICKPWNLARGLDTLVTNNIDCILRLPFSGPKIAQKYIENPVLYNRPEIGYVKFDVRYVLLLRSVKPLKAYVYRNFFLRFANKEFELKDFDDYEKHFTVMNYSNNVLCKVLCDEFITEFERQNPEYLWSVVEKEIFSMFNDVFKCATSKDPPCGVGHSPQSRALYAADIMLSWKDSGSSRIIQPKLLEVNWLPDCKRACEYYRDFYNDIFLLLFKDVENSEKFQILE